MIHLDTNTLIGLGKPDARYEVLNERTLVGEPVSVCAITWHEFVCGPFEKDAADRALALIENRILAIDQDVGELGAVFFNETGRRRGSNADCLIAAAAVIDEAALFTFNTADFARFTRFGLRLL